ncbi:MAG TPA: amidohydrolase family protein [Acidimicrobiia bacterium]|nr:amidohydrolase family protein [Acidimicrobiia bacterium]
MKAPTEGTTVRERDLLVRGGTVVDGTGAPGREADVRIRDGLVTDVDRRLEPHGEVELDASGAFVTPGFLETHTHLDPSLFWDPTCDPLPQHGVTTVLFGNCGLSLAPVRATDVDEVCDVFGYIEDLPVELLANEIPWSWETYGEYADTVRSRSYALNVAGLVGHSVLRIYVMGDNAWERPATADEIARMAEVLDSCMEAGAFGLSTSLGFDTDRNKRLVPSRKAEDDELRALFEVLARQRRVLQFIPSTVPKYLTRDVRRVAELSRGLDLTQTWINVFDDDRRPEYAPSLMDLASELQADGVATIPQVSPRQLDIEVNWDGGMSFYLMEHTWHAVLQAPPDEKRRFLGDAAWRARARDDWDTVPFTMIEHRRPANIVLVSVTDRTLERWVGRTFADLCEARGGHPSDVLADWVLENDLRPGVVATGVANSDPDGVARLLTHPAGVVSNSDAGAHVQMMCGTGDSTLLLTRHVRDRGDLTIEAAVHQITGRAADLFGFRDRGTVTPGGAGDLVVFALEELDWAEPTMIDDLPGGARRLRRPPGGYRATVVGGVPTQREGTLTGARPGALLRA